MLDCTQFEFPLITKGRARIEVLLNATTRRDEQGNVIGVVGIGQDITARMAQEREYSKLIDTANAPIFGVDTQGGKANLTLMQWGSRVLFSFEVVGLEHLWEYAIWYPEFERKVFTASPHEVPPWVSHRKGHVRSSTSGSPKQCW